MSNEESMYEQVQKEMEELLDDSAVEEELLFARAELENENKDFLVAMCRKYGLKHYGTRKELIKRLLTVEDTNENVSILEATSTVVAVKEEERDAVEEEYIESAKGERI
jgi:hypothetical protein